jgi:hypothetical protein
MVEMNVDARQTRNATTLEGALTDIAFGNSFAHGG